MPIGVLTAVLAGWTFLNLISKTNVEKSSVYSGEPELGCYNVRSGQQKKF